MKNNFPTVMFVVLAILVGLAFASGACSSQTELERARAETVRQEVNLEQAKAATTIANADAFSEKSQAVFPYAMIAIFVSTGILIFFVWYLRGPQPTQQAQQGWHPQIQQQQQLPQPIVINLMLPGAGDSRPAMATYSMDLSNGRQPPYLIDAQPTTRDVAIRLID